MVRAHLLGALRAVDIESMGAADAVGDEGHASAGDREVLARVRRARERGAELDERSLRTALRQLRIDPGPLWDRPLHAEPQRLPIRPAALTRLEGLLTMAEHAAADEGDRAQ